MKKKFTPNGWHYFFAGIWLANGLLCKILNLEPRHEEIVTTLFGNGMGSTLTLFIGIAEILMAIWILSGYKRRINAVTQITLILVMNILEFFLVPGLLLWGRLNLFFALILVFFIYKNEFSPLKKRRYALLSKKSSISSSSFF